MNPQLQELFSKYYHPGALNNSVEGASSVAGTKKIRNGILELFKKYNINSIFDAGCNDCGWMSLVVTDIKYHGGDISAPLIDWLLKHQPELCVSLHDITTDSIPTVDLLFCRDVTIHLSDEDRTKFWKNWYANNISWILTTHVRDCQQNVGIEYLKDQFPWAPVNWEIAPWNFPPPTDVVEEYGPNGRCLALWHRDQFKGIL